MLQDIGFSHAKHYGSIGEGGMILFLLTNRALAKKNWPLQDFIDPSMYM
jgi:hypothetical protein